MSYDIQLVIDTGGEYPAAVTDCKSPTYNLGPMFTMALGFPLRELDGLAAGDAILPLKNAVNRMKKSPARFKKLNPSNGWGSYEGALESLCWLLEMCKAHPLATVQT
jgi:hypothetical protein